MTKKRTNIIITIVVKIKPVQICRCGGTGRRTGLKILRGLNLVPVRFRPSAPIDLSILLSFDKSIFLLQNGSFIRCLTELGKGIIKLLIFLEF